MTRGLRALGALAALAASVWVFWAAWGLAAQGRVPLLGLDVEPSVPLAYLFVVVVVPPVTTLAYWVAALVCMPLLAVTGRPRIEETPPLPLPRVRATARTWGAMGSLVLDVRQLRVGHCYHLGFDVAEYVGTFRGARFDGLPSLSTPGHDEFGVWYRFEPAEASPRYQDTAEVRLSHHQVLDSVREIPAPQEQARAVFLRLRALHPAPQPEPPRREHSLVRSGARPLRALWLRLHPHPAPASRVLPR